MDFFDYFDISERYMELLDPTSPEKILDIGDVLGLKPGNRVIDFGCGFGEPLALLAEKFGISGVGIDIREYACERARQKMVQRGLSSRTEIVCGKGAEYPYQKNSFDHALCLGSSFIWSDYKAAIQAMKDTVKPGGRLVIGEPYWLKQPVPKEYAEKYQMISTEDELLKITHREGFEFEYLVRSSTDDWARYEADNWRGLIKWLEENPKHPERQQIIDYLHNSQEEYVKYGREYLGWAIYILSPI
jgi:ubiquinone/menaquinone biosynthesis C-methylase UbiE